MKLALHFIFVLITLSITACSGHPESGNNPVICGDYFGQAPPGGSAMLFAPGVISTGMDERDFGFI